MFPMRTQSVVAISLFVFFGAAKLGAQMTEDHSLKFRLEAPSASGRLQDLMLRVLLENDGSRCVPVFIDPLFSPFMLPHRGVARLIFDIRKSTGEHVSPATSYPPEVSRLTPERLMLLDCGTLYGLNIRLDRSFWRVNLQRGTYTIVARLEFDPVKGIELNDAVRSELSARAGVGRTKIDRMFQKGTFISNEVVVNVQ
jgi:hypothetical protein